MIQLLRSGAIYLLTRQDATVRRIKEALDEWEPEDDGDWSEADFRTISRNIYGMTTIT